MNIATFEGHTDTVHSVSFSPNGALLASASVDGIVRLWDVTSFHRPFDLEKIAEDVNGDGTVNILDLVLVASNFGQTGENIVDIDENGVVNILDLVRVAGALGNAAAAPSLNPQALAMVSAANVRAWISEARQQNLTDPTSHRGIRLLERLLAALLPEENALLPNYPNPFNPETWIPFQLAKPGKVTLTVYSATGALVRTLELGHRSAGYYDDRGKAAYWDGRNDFGEHAANGVYFYHLSAGSYSATRKLLLLK